MVGPLILPLTLTLTYLSSKNNCATKMKFMNNTRHKNEYFAPVSLTAVDKANYGQQCTI